ncbi:MAG: Na/Pi cotransporter family protein, partial [bacterium]
ENAGAGGEPASAMETATVVLSTAGGLALFLYGLRVLSSALKRAVGERMRVLLEHLTNRVYRGVLVGALITGVLQSSSVAMVLLIGLINAGVLTLRQGIGVMLGAEIGTSVTAQIIASKVGDYYLPIIAVGFVLSELFRGRRVGDTGRAMLGFGLLFLGMSVMSGGLRGVARSDAVLRLLESLGSNVPLGVLVGAGVTAVIQSSSAMTALVIAMGSAGILGLPAAIALVLGANIGTTVTAQLASLGSSLPARRLARAQLLVNVIGVAVVLPLVPWYAQLMATTSPSLERQIANAHTFFNVAGTVALLPFVGGLAWLASRIVRGREPIATSTPQHLAEAFLAAPPVALNQARQELLRMADMTGSMISRCRHGLLHRDEAALAEVLEIEQAVDSLKQDIESYLERIPGDALSPREERRLHVLRHATGDVERVGDQAVNIAERGEIVLRKGSLFSEPALADLAALFDKTALLYGRALGALREEDKEHAQEALHLEAEVDHLERLFKDRHLKRLDEGVCDASAGVLFVEILHNLERIGDHAVNIAGDVLYAL